MLETAENRTAHLSRLAVTYEKPGGLPQEVWMQLGGEPIDVQEKADECMPDPDLIGYDDYDDDDEDSIQSHARDGVVFALSARIERIDAGCEIWPESRLNRAKPLTASASRT
jgi:hypothetical protein